MIDCFKCSPFGYPGRVNEWADVWFWFDLIRSPAINKRRSSSVFSPVRTPGKRQSLRRSLLHGSSAKKTGFIVTEILKDSKDSDNDVESCSSFSPGECRAVESSKPNRISLKKWRISSDPEVEILNRIPRLTLISGLSKILSRNWE